MNYSVADAITSMGEDAISGRAGDISAILPFGIAPGAKDVLRKERRAAKEAISSGIYVTWRSMKTGQDCARVGSMSRCFCGCSYGMHAFRKGSTLPICTKCECQGFDFVPSRPEEIGEWWLPRRPGFDASSWRAKCRCGHTHEAHHPSRRNCGSCKCSGFYSAYGCVVCDAHQEDHQTQVETAQDRATAGRSVGRDYVPLSQSPQLSQLTFGRKPSRAPVDVSFPPKTVVRTAASEAGCSVGVGNSSLRAEESSSSLTTPPSPSTYQARGGGRRLPSGFAGLGVIGRAGTFSLGSKGVFSGPPSAAPSRHTTVAPSKGWLHRQQQREQPYADRTVSRLEVPSRFKFDAGGGKHTMTPSPELLYASGRITAAGYHEMLAEMNGRGEGDSATTDPSRRVASTSNRKAPATPPRKSTDGTRRQIEPVLTPKRLTPTKSGCA